MLTGNADNSSGSTSLTITDWTNNAIVTSISNLTKINSNGGVAADGGFAQLSNGTAVMANANTVFINENHNAGTTPRNRGFSFTFTLNDTCHPTTLTVLSGHANGAGGDQSFSSDLVYKLSGGTLGAPVTASSTENYGSNPAYHSVGFDLSGTTLGAGAYTLEIYQTGSDGGSYASFDGITLDGYIGTPPPVVSSFTATPALFDSGETITLSWNVTGSTSVSIDQGIGSVAASGSLVLSPEDTTTYTLTALNGALPATASATVTMRQDVDVYLFGGQSNMQGLGKISELTPQQLTAPANVYYWNGSSFEPFIPGTTVTASAGQFGPELAFAHAVSNPKRKSYIIKYASSGMPLDSAWSGSSYDDHTNTWKGDPPGPGRLTFYPGISSTDPNQGTLYKNKLLPIFQAGIADITATGYTPVIRKFLWMQGEQDSKMELSAGRNAANLKRLRDRLAEDLGLANPTDLPMVFGQVLPYSPSAPRFAYRNLIRSQQASADMDSGSPNAIPSCRMISTDSYSLKSDTVHYDTAGQLQLGADFAAGSNESSVSWDFEDPTSPEVATSNDTGLVVSDFTLTAPAGAGYITVLPDAPDEGTSGSLGSETRAGVAARNDSDIATSGAQAMSFTLTIPSGKSFDFNSLSFEHGFNEKGSNSLTPTYTLSINDGINDIYSTTGNLPQHTSGTDLFYSEDVFLDLSAEQALQNISNKTLTIQWKFSNPDGRSNTLAQRAHTIDDLTLSGRTTTVTLPTINAFSASDTLIDAGQTITLSWNVSDADILTINPGNIDVSNDPDQQIAVTVNEATTYSLTAINSDGSIVENLPIYLNPTVPNVLVVLVDDMGTEDCSVDFNYDDAGNKIDRIDPTSVGLAAFTTDNRHFRTPNMETLASQGMKFSRAYACQVCSPTRVTFLTGQNSARHGTIQYISGGGNLHNLKAPPNPGLKAFNKTLAEVMRDAGYRTIISGKGHIGNAFNANAGNYITPASPADDYYGFQVNISASTNGQQGSNYSNHSTAFGLPNSGPPSHFIAEYQNKTYNDIDPTTYPTSHPHANEPVFVTEAITRELNERIEDSVNQGKPFFAYLSHFAVHDPHTPDPRFTANYPGLSGDVLDFATMIEGMDQSLGDVLTKLNELGVAENTLVIFLGDNGSDSKPRGPNNPPTLTMTNPLRGEKGMRYEGGIRVPLIISWAKRDGTNIHQQKLTIPAASRENDIVSVEDLFPTILATCGIPLPTTDDDGAPLVIDGTDLSPYLKSVAGTHRPQKLITHAPCSSRSSFFTTYHEGTWKLIYNYTTSSPVTSTNVPLGTYELYNLATDIHEANNLAATHPERVMTMARGMAKELQRLGAPYPILRAYDPDLDGLGLPSAANDTHPVILPDLAGVDSDNDSLDDNIEDPNRNGLVDPGETDPDNDNTDGDNINDGEEAKIGTDPLDSNSFFFCHPANLPDGSLQITWPSSPGNSFLIRSSTDLEDWTTIVANAISASPGSMTTYNLGITSSSKIFFRVELE